MSYYRCILGRGLDGVPDSLNERRKVDYQPQLDHPQEYRSTHQDTQESLFWAGGLFSGCPGSKLQGPPETSGQERVTSLLTAFYVSTMGLAVRTTLTRVGKGRTDIFPKTFIGTPPTMNITMIPSSRPVRASGH